MAGYTQASAASQHPGGNKDKKKRRRAEQLLIEWTTALLVALVLAVIATQVVFINAQIPSESMNNTILTSDRVIGFRLAYLFGAPEREDIILFKYPDNEEQTYIKRVIGVPGDSIEIKIGRVYLNGEEVALPEPYVSGDPMGQFGPYVVPEDCYFVMGDNRNNSWDSRYWENTFVRSDQIYGKAWFIIYPRLVVL